jgi:hypothetical protein
MAAPPFMFKLPSIVELHGSLDLQGIEHLENLDLFAQLKTVESAVFVSGNKNMASATLPALESVGRGLELSQMPLVMTIELPMLVHVGSSAIKGRSFAYFAKHPATCARNVLSVFHDGSSWRGIVPSSLTLVTW